MDQPIVTAQHPNRRFFLLGTAVKGLALALALSAATPSANIVSAAQAPAAAATKVHYRNVTVGNAEVFYREAGPASAPTLLLLHGFPSSSHMFRDLIPLLADRYHIVAPDLPGFGFTKIPAGTKLDFAKLTDTIEGFTNTLKLDRFAIYVFDYGAPVGYRLALRNPSRITAIISQNGNAYEEGLSAEGWNPIANYWKSPTQENRDKLRPFLTLDTTKWQYTHGAADPTLIAPESYTLDQLGLDRQGNAEIQLDLFGDYQSNVALYPKFQAYFRSQHPPLLAVWGKNDPFFLPAGAAAYKRDNPNAEIHMLDAGHFALETHAQEIAALIRPFLERNLKPKR